MVWEVFQVEVHISVSVFPALFALGLAWSGEGAFNEVNVEQLLNEELPG